MPLIIDDSKFQNQATVLQAASVVDGELGKRLREAIYNEMRAARNRIVSDIHFNNGDPRGSAHAVKRYVASKYLGGVISILDGKSSGGAKSSYEAPRKLRVGQRGGNRRLRGERTQAILNYPPQQRGFILRFVNSGTKTRYAGYGRNGKTESAYTKFIERNGGRGNRGAIAARNFFGTSGAQEVQKALQNLSKIIDEEFEKVFK